MRIYPTGAAGHVSEELAARARFLRGQHGLVVEPVHVAWQRLAGHRPSTSQCQGGPPAARAGQAHTQARHSQPRSHLVVEDVLLGLVVHQAKHEHMERYGIEEDKRASQAMRQDELPAAQRNSVVVPHLAMALLLIDLKLTASHDTT
eukprot:scaffold149_cov383-Prasinococcus_capsulatus_cf.AAC.10